MVLFAVHGLVAGSFAEQLTEPALVLTPPAADRLGLEHVIDAPGAAARAAPISLEAALRQGARVDDGLLTASEVAALDLNADWVILSACDTASGETGQGDAEGLSGLAAGFFYAGAKSLLVSHWRVRDDVASEVTTDAVARAKADPTLSWAEASSEIRFKFW